jgi:fructokinase
VGIGELLWDILPAGEQLGGAPFNVVAHLRRFGWSARFISAVGADEYGRRALAEVDRLGIDSSLIAINELPTGLVRVVLDDAGAPSYAIQSPAAYESIPVWADYGPPAPEVLVFGTLAQCFDGARAATRRLANIAPSALRLFDVNLRFDRWTVALVTHLLDLATLVKLNEDEQRTLSAPLDLPAHSVESFARALADRHALRGVCVTRGAMGAGLLLDGTYVEAPAPIVRVLDTVGAGDAFAAALAHGVFQGWPASETVAVANRLGSLVASRAGASPNWRPDELGIA